MKEELIIKFLNDQCSEEELCELKSLLKNENFDKELGELLYRRWDGQNDTKVSENHRRMLVKIRKEIGISKTTAESGKVRRIDYTYFAKIAASLLILISVSFGVFYLIKDSSVKPVAEAKKMLVKKTNYGEKLTFMLPDSSKVVLNSGSTLQYPNSLGNDPERRVILSGEAYFEVYHSDIKPFEVITEVGKTTVLGTKFNMRSREDRLEVTLAEGKVKVSKDGESVILAPGNMALLNLSEKEIFVEEVEVSKVLAWKEGILHFDGESLKDVLAKLEEWYAVDINMDKGINEKLTLKGEFNNESLRNILSGLSFSLDFQFILNDKTVIIKKI